jgi:FtsZ-binding cell division protein ZapB
MNKAIETLEKKAKQGLSAIKALALTIMAKLGFSTYASTDGSIILQFPDAEPKEGDKVIAELNGEIIENYTGEVEIVGESGEFKVSIVEGIVKSVQKIKNQEVENQQEQVKDTNSEVAMTNAVKTIEMAIAIKLSELKEENETIKNELKSIKEKFEQLNKQHETLWNKYNPLKKETSNTTSTIKKFY